MSEVQLMVKHLHLIYINNNKTNISTHFPLIHTCTCAKEGVKNVSFSKNLAYVLNG